MVRRFSRRSALATSLGATIAHRGESRGQQIATPIAVRAPHFVLLLPNAEGSFWLAVRDAVETACLAENIALRIESLTEPSVHQQVSMLEQIAQTGADGVLIGPVDPAGVMQGIEAVSSAGIPVVTIDLDLPTAKVSSYVYSDITNGCADLGRYLDTIIPAEGIVVCLVDSMDDPQYAACAEGLQIGLGESEERLVSPALGYGVSDAGPRAAENFLYEDWTPTPTKVTGDTPTPSPTPEETATSTPPPLERIAIFCASDEIAVVVATEPVENSARLNIPIVCYGLSPDVARLISDGIIAAAVSDRPADIGSRAVQALLDVRAGVAVPRSIDVGHDIVTTTNVATPVASPVP